MEERSNRERLRVVYHAIKHRCTSPSSKDYKWYGAKGVKLCDEWADERWGKAFNAFADWCMANGWAPGLSVDRIDPDGGYCPANCRIITVGENARRAQLARSARRAAEKEGVKT